MGRDVEHEVQMFQQHMTGLAKFYSLTELAEFAWKIEPNDCDVVVPEGKEIALTILGLTHGNEVAGLAVVNEFLMSLLAGVTALKVPIVVALSNPGAALEGKRFIDRDLNRSFDNNDSETKEGRRAKELEGFLSKTWRLLDFHQTMQISEMPFFIFPYTKSGFEFARKIDPCCAIVTHWGGGFSAEGRCTDEYVNRLGGAGISFELGQNGFDDYQIAYGTQGALWALQSVTSEITKGNSLDRAANHQTLGPIFTWEKIISFPKEGVPILDQGWHNFKSIQKGERLGEIDGELLSAEASGRIIFPKYVTKDAKWDRRPTELYRVMKEVGPADLPT